MADFKIIGVYDSETCNVGGAVKRAFPILHQLGIYLHFGDVSDITPENVEDLIKVSMYRHTHELTYVLDCISRCDFGFVPVICCHNLGFDMYPLSCWLNSRKVRVLAKSARKPISFTIQDETDAPRLVLWDTAVFSQKPLSLMGHECGYEKGVGEWDYSLVRTPYTALTDDELDYARRDIYALFAWLGYWLRLNPEIPESMLGINIVTKTGVVRAKRRIRFDAVTGKGQRCNVGRYWHYLNKGQLPKTDDELFTMHACTRGGFTFCASKWAGVAIDGQAVSGYDATSQHPAQMVSRRYPVGFHRCDGKTLKDAFNVIAKIPLSRVVEQAKKPFPFAFNACFTFENLRPKPGSVFERDGIYPLASARFRKKYDADTDNQDAQQFNQAIFDDGYHDSAVNARIEFGKLVSADVAHVYLTELAAWEVAQAYEWDAVRCEQGGYFATKFSRPSDMSILSVMQFYKAKNAFKRAREEYFKDSTITNGQELRECGFSDAIIGDLENGKVDRNTVEFLYLGTKADLNGLFGIEATNEFRKDTALGNLGIEYIGTDGLHNAPKNPKAWYQFGQRIVGWSRIAQCCIMILCADCAKAYVNGDTDSLKMLDADKDKVNERLSYYARHLDAAKRDTCARVEESYPSLFDPLEGVGHYELEFETTRFCASWNKAYCYEGRNGLEFTLAGIPTSRPQLPADIERIANARLDDGEQFGDIVADMLGYNLTVAPDITGLNQRVVPEWGSMFIDDVTDYTGNAYRVAEPAAMGLFPMAKTVNDTAVIENQANCIIAKRNNRKILTRNRILTAEGTIYRGMHRG